MNVVTQGGRVMDMLKVSAGKLRALGYDAKTRTLRVQLDDGSVLEYSGIAEALWRRFQSAGSQWSFYRDNIEEEFTARRVSASAPVGKNLLDDLFKL
jgi:hypothetical protein